MLELFEQIEAAAAAIRREWKQTPRAGIILGTGLGNVAGEIQSPVAIEYEKIPHFPRSTATSHRGRLVCGELAGVPVVAMEGRFHQYEGYPLKQITLPVRVMKALGADHPQKPVLGPRFQVGSSYSHRHAAMGYKILTTGDFQTHFNQFRRIRRRHVGKPRP